MAYTFKTNLANKKNYGGKRNTSAIKYIVLHYTSNDGDTDENNAKYFKNNIVEASAHYFVDDDSVTQSVPDNYVAWSVGGKKYSDCATTGGGKYYGKATNKNTLNIEICDDVKNGTVYPSAKTIENAIELTKKKMKEYGVPKENVIRHFDVTGKKCPAYWCATTSKDLKWKSEFWNKLTTAAKPASTTTSKPVVSKPDVIYQVYANGKWLSEIINYNETNSNGYAGIFGKEISGIRVRLSNGKKVTVRSHVLGNARTKWLSAVTKWDNTENGYSGIKGKATDCIAMKADGHTLKYRVHIKGGNWLGWVSKYNINDYNAGLAGAYGKPIDAVQIMVV